MTTQPKPSTLKPQVPSGVLREGIEQILNKIYSGKEHIGDVYNREVGRKDGR